MSAISYTLLGDGPSDRLLDYPIRWALRRAGIRVNKAQWADFSLLTTRPTTLADRIQTAISHYPSDILFVHRDAETSPVHRRQQEIQEATASIPIAHVAIIPIRMTEAWLLHDEQAIRRASGNPAGRVELRLPQIRRLENLPDPKETLFSTLLDASELTGRRRSKLEKASELSRMRMRTAELIEDFSPLLEVSAFANFFQDLNQTLQNIQA